MLNKMKFSVKLCRRYCVMVFVVLPLLMAGCTMPVVQTVEPVTPATAEATIPVTASQSGEALTVAAAADLQFAFEDIAALFEKDTGVPVTLVFGSTGQLALQIENGAPYDLFAAANISYVEDLRDKGLTIPGTVALYARGRIVLAVNKASGIEVSTLNDLLKPEVRVVSIANPDHAPYGVAAKQALEAEGVWDALKAKLVYGENVRQALQYIQTGDAQAGIVALSVANTPEISWVLLDQELHKPLDQALAILRATKHEEAARAFVDFVNGEQGRLIMRHYGFVLPGETPLLTPVAP